MQSEYISTPQAITERGPFKWHAIKNKQGKGKPLDKYKVDPATGDVIDPEGEVVGTLGY